MPFRIIVTFLILVVFPAPIQAETNGEILKVYNNKNNRQVEQLYWGTTKDKYVLISYPENFDPEKTYHINFWFPGTSGKPSQGIEDKNDQYIGIGLSYLEESAIPQGAYYPAHWDLCEKVEASLLARKKIKIGQRVLSGVSKGGWMGYYTSLNPPKNLDGVAIIAAGIPSLAGAESAPKSNSSHLAVLIATGETDPNYPYSQLAIPYYKKSSVASLCYEEWLGEGHISKVSPRVNEWLDVQALRGGSAEELRQGCEDIVSQHLRNISLSSDQVATYIALRHLLGSPSMRYVSQETKKKVITEGKTLSQTEVLKNWLLDFNQIKSLVKKETSLFGKGPIKTKPLGDVVVLYKALAQSSEYPDIRARAANSYLRAFKMYSMNKLQDEAKAAPEYSKIHNQFETLRKRHNGSRQGLQPNELAQLQKLQGELAVMSRKITMDSFYAIEWHKKFSPDPAMIAIMNEKNPKDQIWQAYSGVRY